MRKDKESAIEMRKTGKSYRQIREELKIPLSTLSDWFSKLDWSEEIARKLAKEVQKKHTARLVELDKIRGRHLERAYEEGRVEAARDLEKFKYNPVFIAGMMLYWGEGDKLTDHAVKLANTDPELIHLFVFFLTRVCRIQEKKIGVHLLLYPDLDDRSCQRYWARASGLPLTNFTKSTVIMGRHKTRRLSFGVCIVNVSSTYFKVKMLEWLKLLPNELMNRRYYENIVP